MNEFESYKIYCAVKAHYNSKNGSIQKTGLYGTRQKVFHYKERYDQKLFKRFSSLYQTEYRATCYLAANLFMDTDLWIGDMLDDYLAKANYTRLRKFKDNVKENVYRDCVRMKNEYGSMKNAITPTDSFNIPPVYKSILGQTQDGEYSIVAPETLVILDKIFGIHQYAERGLSNKIIWEKLKNRLHKYAAFVLISDTEKETIRDRVREAFA